MKEKVKTTAVLSGKLIALLLVLAFFVGFTPYMSPLLTKCIVTGAFAAYTLVLASKWGFVEYIQVHGSRLAAEMASCDFCLSWWTCVLFCGIGWVVTGALDWIPATFAATMFCRVIK